MTHGTLLVTAGAGWIATSIGVAMLIGRSLRRRDVDQPGEGDLLDDDDDAIGAVPLDVDLRLPGARAVDAAALALGPSTFSAER